MEEDAATFAARLKHRAHTYGFLTCLLLVASSIVGDAGGPLFSWLWPLMIIGGLITLFLAVYLRFDAALFSFIASHEDETEGCRAVDDHSCAHAFAQAPESNATSACAHDTDEQPADETAPCFCGFSCFIRCFDSLWVVDWLNAAGGGT